MRTNTMNKQIHVVGVISSSNANGSTAALVREALKGAAEAGATVTEIFLPQYQLEFCTGCSHCMATGKCRFTDDFEALKTQLAEADGIILSSPTYAVAANAIMKRFLERIGMFERFTSEVFGGKYVAGISTGKSSGAQKVADYLVGFGSASIFKRGYVSGSLGIILRGGKTAAEDPQALQKAHQLGRKIVRDITSDASYPLQNLVGRLVNNYLLKPLFRKNIVTYKDNHMRGVYNNLQQRGLLV